MPEPKKGENYRRGFQAGSDAKQAEIVGVIEGMKKPTLTKPAKEGIIGTRAINYDYNQALADLTDLIEQIKKAE